MLRRLMILSVPAMLFGQTSLDRGTGFKLPPFLGQAHPNAEEFSKALRDYPDQPALRMALVKAVERCLETDCTDNRIQSVMAALSELREERAIGPLWKIVGDDDRFAAGRPWDAPPFYLGIINSAARAIAQIDPKGQHAKIMARFTNSPRDGLREQIIRGLATSADPDILSQLERYVSGEPDPRNRRRLSEVLEPMRARVRAAKGAR